MVVLVTYKQGSLFAWKKTVAKFIQTINHFPNTNDLKDTKKNVKDANFTITKKEKVWF